MKAFFSNLKNICKEGQSTKVLKYFLQCMGLSAALLNFLPAQEAPPAKADSVVRCFNNGV